MFAESCVESSLQNWVPTQVLYDSYQEYAEEESLFTVGTKNGFSQHLRQWLDEDFEGEYRKAKRVHEGEQKRGFQGIALTDEARARIEEEEGENPLDQY